MSIIQTDTQRCRSCYACVRHCPVKAIRVTPEGTDSIPGLCIGCGRCLQVCSRRARSAPNALKRCRRLLKHKEPMAAIVAPSFPAYMTDIRPGQMVSALHELGFQTVVEGAHGVDLLAEQLAAAGYAHANGPATIIGHCPAAVSLLERHFPQLLRNLAPYVSPLVATARALRATHGGPLRIVTISSCFAAKLEALDDQIQDTIDAALTFSEIAELFEDDGITPTRLPESPFDGPPTKTGGLFPISGGAMTTLLPDVSHGTGDVLSAEGTRNALEVLRDLAAGRIKPSLVDLRLCRGGCLGPCDPGSRLSPFARAQQIRLYVRQNEHGKPHTSPVPSGAAPDLRRTFSNRQPPQDHPAGESIRRVLHSTDKFTSADELNCGACGYRSCREHAAAVCRNLAVEDMCLPFFVKRLKADQSHLQRAAQLARYQEGTEAVAKDGLLPWILDPVQEVAAGDQNVLIRGEIGTGKTTAAGAIHRHGPRSDQPFATLNCSGMDDRLLMIKLFGNCADKDRRQGLLELTDGGTLLLEEIGDTGPGVQKQLLEYLERRAAQPTNNGGQSTNDVRLIVTSRRELEQGVRDGWFNGDLFYRLSRCTIFLPPLRHRSEALHGLALQKIRRIARGLNKNVPGIAPSAMQALQRYPWPGNMRELAAVLERAVILSENDEMLRPGYLCLPPADTPDTTGATGTNGSSDFRARRGHQMEMIERHLLERYLRETSGNVSAAARRANLPRRTFYRLMERYGINRREFVTRQHPGKTT